MQCALRGWPNSFIRSHWNSQLAASRRMSWRYPQSWIQTPPWTFRQAGHCLGACTSITVHFAAMHYMQRNAASTHIPSFTAVCRIPCRYRNTCRCNRPGDQDLCQENASLRATRDFFFINRKSFCLHIWLPKAALLGGIWLNCKIYKIHTLRLLWCFFSFKNEQWAWQQTTAAVQGWNLCK